jgi:hypothetical protein
MLICWISQSSSLDKDASLELPTHFVFSWLGTTTTPQLWWNTWIIKDLVDICISQSSCTDKASRLDLPTHFLFLLIRNYHLATTLIECLNNKTPCWYFELANQAAQNKLVVSISQPIFPFSWLGTTTIPQLWSNNWIIKRLVDILD